MLNSINGPFLLLQTTSKSISHTHLHNKRTQLMIVSGEEPLIQILGAKSELRFLCKGKPVLKSDGGTHKLVQTIVCTDTRLQGIIDELHVITNHCAAFPGHYLRDSQNVAKTFNSVH